MQQHSVFEIHLSSHLPHAGQQVIMLQITLKKPQVIMLQKT